MSVEASAILSPWPRERSYIQTARGRLASRRISLPPRCLPRVTSWRSAVGGMSDSQDGGVPRLSGQWVRLSEAFAWVATRDTSFAIEQSNVTRNRLKLALVFHFGGNDGSVFQRSEAALLSALQRDEIKAKARPGDLLKAQQPHADISSHQWATMRFGENGEFFRAQTEHGAGDPEFWHDVLIRSDELVAAFPALVLALQDEKGTYDVGVLEGEQKAILASGGVPSQLEDGYIGKAPDASDAENVAMPNMSRLRRGALSLEGDDDGAVQEMRRLIEISEARNPTQAANMVFSYMKIEGLGREDSRIKRLVRRYKKRFLLGGSD